MQLREISRLIAIKTSLKFFICATLVVLADFLLYHEGDGWNIGLFRFAVVIAVFICTNIKVRSKYFYITFYAALGLAFANIESESVLAWWLGLITIVALALMPKFTKVLEARDFAKIIMSYLIRGWVRLFNDAKIIMRLRKRAEKSKNKKQAFIFSWLLPIGLSAVFIALFSEANPVIKGWLDRVVGNFDLFNITYEKLSRRIYFWIMIACGCWALIRPKFKINKYFYIPIRNFSGNALLFNEKSIFASLVLFNGLFFVQNILDVTFLWSGAALPSGMTYAQYAHQGAYPLIFTALLACWFVLKAGKTAEKMPIIRSLIYIWVAQNIFLVFSSITRLMGYIEEYYLTYLRIFALIWMLLVALGLIFIVIRMHLQKSNLWLVNANAIVLYATLYLCCFINFGEIIVNYNINHSKELTGVGKNLDIYYLKNEVGIESLPALLKIKQKAANYKRPAFMMNPESLSILESVCNELEIQLNYSMKNWRQWTFRKHRISKLLQTSKL